MSAMAEAAASASSRASASSKRSWAVVVWRWRWRCGGGGGAVGGGGGLQLTFDSIEQGSSFAEAVRRAVGEAGLDLDEASRGSLPIQGEGDQGPVEMGYADADAYLTTQMSVLHWDATLGAFADVGLAGAGDGDDLIKSLVGKCGDTKVQKTVHIPLEAIKARQEAGEQVKFSEFCPKEHPEFLYPIGDGRGGYEMVETNVLYWEG